MSDALFAKLHSLGAELDRRDIDWAVGGAHAMAAHGFTRETQDIDVFISPESREEVLQICNEMAMPVEQIFAESHYAYIPNSAQPDKRIDVLFPYARPDITAVVFPERMELRGGQYPVWALYLIVVAKLQSARAKDLADLDALYELGLVEVAKVHAYLEEEGDREAIERLLGLVERARRRHAPPPLPSLHRRNKAR